MDNYEIKGYYLATMTPQEQVLELLGRLSSDLAGAKSALQEAQFERLNSLLINAQNILLELQGSIRGEDDISWRTSDLLGSLTDCLFYVNLNRDAKLLDEVTALLNRLKAIYAAQTGKLRFQ